MRADILGKKISEKKMTLKSSFICIIHLILKINFQVNAHRVQSVHWFDIKLHHVTFDLRKIQQKKINPISIERIEIGFLDRRNRTHSTTDFLLLPRNSWNKFSVPIRFHRSIPPNSVDFEFKKKKTFFYILNEKIIKFLSEPRSPWKQIE